MKLIEHFVGGKVIPGSSDKKGKVYNPATGEQESEVRLASKSDLDQAVEVAKKALVIPQRCVIEIQGQYSVFAVGENNTVVSKPVVVGYKMGDLVLIESGLVAEDRIVIDAIQKVGSGTVIEPELTTFTSKTNE